MAKEGTQSGVPEIRLSGSLRDRLERAERACCRLDGAVTASPLAEAYLEMHQKREAVRSAALAGRATTLIEMLSQEAAYSAREEPTAAACCLRALQAGTAQAGPDGWSAERLVEMHGILAGGAETADPFEDSRDAAALGELAGYLESIVRGAASPVLAHVGLVQARLEAGSAFGAGNRRLGRLIVCVVLHRRRRVPLGVSDYFLSRAAEYRARSRLGGTRGGRDAWLAFFLQGITDSASRAVDEIAKIAAMREEHREAVASSLGHAVPKALRVLERLFQRPVATVAEIPEITGTSYVAANQLVSKLVDLGILEEVTGYRRNRVFLYGPYLRILDGGQGPDSQGLQAAPAPRTGSRKTAPKSAPSGSERPAGGAAGDKGSETVAAQATPASPARRSPDLEDHLL